MQKILGQDWDSFTEKKRKVVRWSFSSVIGSQSGLDSDNHQDSRPSKGWWSGLWPWEERENEQQRSRHLPQPSCPGFGIYVRARHLWLTLSTFHTYTSIQRWWMQVGPSIPLKPGFIAQNQSGYEESYGRELKDRNRQGALWATSSHCKLLKPSVHIIPAV